MPTIVQDALQKIDANGRVDRIADKFQRSITQTYDQAGTPGRRVKNFLHGTWLGHPLHSALSDVPIGAWTTTFAFDAFDAIRGRQDSSNLAIGTLAIGLAGSAAAAAAGFTDWSRIDGRARRTGLLHGMLNATIATLNMTSLGFRLAGHGGTGRKLSFAAYGIAGFSAYLGGHLVFRERIGVNHADDTPSESQFQTVMSIAELIDGKPHQVKVDGVSVLLVKLGDDIRAITDTCTHLGCSLAEGTVEGESVTCPCHGSQFSLKDGHVVNGPATFPETALEIRAEQGQIALRFAPK
jgi:nitrite reductase/ring-hydroxylating ferredoxin subunit/uncharacterized membrane protein